MEPIAPKPAAGRRGRGLEVDFLVDLVTHWAPDYRWREHEARIRAPP